MQNDFLNILQNSASKQQELNVEKLQNLYFDYYPKRGLSDFFWDLQKWKEEKILQTLGNKYYKVRRIFNPSLSDLSYKVYQNLAQNFDLEPYCFSESTWYNQFSRHQSPQSLYLIELEKELCESVFYHLKGAGYENVFLLLEKKDTAVLERYAFEVEKPIIIQKIVSKAPTQDYKSNQNNIKIPYLEKMLVDLFVDENLFLAYKGAEQNTVIENMLRDYVINLKKLFAYAQRRRKEKELKQYLFENFAQEINQIIR
ncbi:MAG: hypothetical protein JJT94_11545 [Bernardetiaceae bacterium]|nr:hypothetical protein [Bernardetiaceae bacterium]